MISNSILKVGGIELESLDFFARNKNNFQSNIRQKCQKGRFYGKGFCIKFLRKQGPIE